MEWFAAPLDYKSANANKFKGAPNRYERHLNEEPDGITVERRVAPGYASPGAKDHLALRSGWAAGGNFSLENHQWFAADEPPPKDAVSPPGRGPQYGKAHKHHVRASG